MNKFTISLFLGGLASIGGISYGLINYFSKSNKPIAQYISKWSKDGKEEERCEELFRNNQDDWQEVTQEKCSELIKKIEKEEISNKYFYWVSSNKENIKDVLLRTDLIKKNLLENDKIPESWNYEVLTCNKKENSKNSQTVIVRCNINLEEANKKWYESTLK